jgi:hypothetical protein
LQEALVQKANRLVNDVADLNDILNAQGSLLSAYANLRLQPWIIFIAIASAVVGAIGAFPTVRDFYNWGVSVKVEQGKATNPAHTQETNPLNPAGKPR